MDCFKTEWREHCPFDRAEEYIPHPVSGVYAICQPAIKASNNERVWRVGKTQDFSSRMRGYRQVGATLPIQTKRLTVSFGIIHPLEGDAPVSITDISSVERLLLFKIRPPGNDPRTCRRYTGKRHILIANTGDLESVGKIMTSIHDLDELLNPKRKPTRRKASRTASLWPKINLSKL